MKPRNSKQRYILELSGQLRPLTPAQKQWAFCSTINHYAYRLKSGKTTCMACGTEWEENRNGMIICPKCGARLEVKDTLERVLRDKSYFNVITTAGDYQVVRMFLMMVEMRKGMKAKPAFLEIGQYFIDHKGHTTVVGLQRTIGRYVDSFLFGSPLEIRNDNDAFRFIACQWVYPHVKVTETIRRNGFKNSTYAINPVDLFTQLLTNPKAETLMKQGEVEMLRHLVHHPYDVDRYWNSVKIAKRSGYKVKDVSMWFDYVKMLDRMGRDLNSPRLIAPTDLKAAHDDMLTKINRQRLKEQRTEERKRAAEDKVRFEELKSRFFGMVFTDGNITLHTPTTIDEYYDLGEKMSLCVASSRYYVKESSLVLTATIGDKTVAVIEISLSDYSILQCRAFANGISEYSERIANIIAANTALIAERKAA